MRQEQRVKTFGVGILLNALHVGWCFDLNSFSLDEKHSDNFLFFSPGPHSPDVTHIQVTQGRSLGIAVYWITVQGATSYLVLASNGQYCNTSDSYCYISPQECGQNHSVSVVAYNEAGPSSPSQPADYITCWFITYNPDPVLKNGFIAVLLKLFERPTRKTSGFWSNSKLLCAFNRPVSPREHLGGGAHSWELLGGVGGCPPGGVLRGFHQEGWWDREVLQYHKDHLPVFLHVRLHLPHQRVPLQPGRHQSLRTCPQLHNQWEHHLLCQNRHTLTEHCIC